MLDSIDRVENAVLSRDIPGIINVYEEILPTGKKLLPYFKNPRLRKIFGETVNHVEELLAKLKAEAKDFSHVKIFLQKILAQSTILLGEILIETENPNSECSEFELEIVIEFEFSIINDFVNEFK